MSFQAYIDNIRAKTGKAPEDFKKIAEKKGLLKPGVKAGEIIAWAMDMPWQFMLLSKEKKNKPN